MSAACLWAVCSIAIAALVTPGPAGVGGRALPATAAPGDSTPNATLAISPSSWWLETGASVVLHAAWIDVAPGCALQPVWFRWTVGSGGSEGTLAETNASSAVFNADDQGSGSTTIVVRSAATVRCGPNASAVAGEAGANVTVAAPVAVGDLTVTPDPAVPGATVELDGTVEGGTPPYRLLTAWGDGSSSWANVTLPGPFSVPHVYNESGAFRPHVLAVDASGWSTNASVVEVENVSTTFAAAIDASTLVAEVGVPVRFSVVTLHAPPSIGTLFACSNAHDGGPWNGSGLTYGCAFNSPGRSSVEFEGVGGASPYPVASAALVETVVAHLTATLLPPTGPGEVGLVQYAPVEIAGGVPPYSIAWSLVGTDVDGTAAAVRDGTTYVPLHAATAGTFVWSVYARDALGQTSPPVSEALRFAPLLNLTAAAVAEVGSQSVAVNLTGAVLGGVPPYAWTVVPSEGAGNTTLLAGLLPLPGAVDWNATYRAEGSLGLTFEVVDSAGAARTVSQQLALVPELSIAVGVAVRAAGEITLALAISGGVPPYAYRWNDSAGESWTGNAGGPGTVLLRETTHASGACSFHAVVTDALGRTVSSGASVRLPQPDPILSPAASGDLAVPVAIVVAGGGGAVAWGLRRRRSKAGPTPPPEDPVAVLREIIGPADGIDRGLVELLAAERGISAEQVAETLARLGRDGTIRSERGYNGEEVLAWFELPRP